MTDRNPDVESALNKYRNGGDLDELEPATAPQAEPTQPSSAPRPADTERANDEFLAENWQGLTERERVRVYAKIGDGSRASELALALLLDAAEL